MDEKYVLLGFWPQDVKKKSVVVDDKTYYNINGWNCYKASDKNYYVKKSAELYRLSQNDNISLFSDNTQIQDGKTYYFMLKDIKWRVIEEDENSILLLCNNILFPFSFYDGLIYDEENLEWSGEKRFFIDENSPIYPNNYKYSTIKSYLNSINEYKDSGFIDLAFDSNKISLLEENENKDRVFLPSFSTSFLPTATDFAICSLLKNDKGNCFSSDILEENYVKLLNGDYGWAGNMEMFYGQYDCGVAPSIRISKNLLLYKFK